MSLPGTLPDLQRSLLPSPMAWTSWTEMRRHSEQRCDETSKTCPSFCGYLRLTSHRRGEPQPKKPSPKTFIFLREPTWNVTFFCQGFLGLYFPDCGTQLLPSSERNKQEQIATKAQHLSHALTWALRFRTNFQPVWAIESRTVWCQPNQMSANFMHLYA